MAGETDLWLSVKQGDLVAVQAALVHADVNARSRTGWTPLMLAAQRGQPTIVEALLQHGAKVNNRDDRGWTALMRAVERAQQACALLLLQAHADVFAVNASCRTALMLAIRSRLTQVIPDILWRYQSDWRRHVLINLRDNFGASALWEAAHAGLAETAKSLMDMGADFRSATRYVCSSAWFEAVRSGHPAVVKVMLDAGADVEAVENENTPLMVVAQYARAGVARLLLERGANVDARWRRLTVLALACDSRSSKSKLSTVKTLLDYGADVNAANGVALDRALSRSIWSNNTALIHLLLERGAHVSLMQAVRLGDVGRVQAALSRGEDANGTDSVGMTPLMYAALWGLEEIVGLLLAHGADVNRASDNGTTALKMARRNGNPKMVAMLQDAGAVA